MASGMVGCSERRLSSVLGDARRLPLRRCDSSCRSTYLASRSVSMLTTSPTCKLAERRVCQRVRNQGDAEAVGLDVDERQADAIDGDRALARPSAASDAAARGT